MNAVKWTRWGLAVLMLVELLLAFVAVDAVGARRELNEAVAAAKEPHWEDVADWGIHLAGLVNAGVLLVLLVTAGFWLRPFLSADAGAESGSPVRRPAWQRWLWPAAVLLLAVWYGSMSFAPRSLWWDELWQVKNASHGSWKLEEGKEPRFSPTSWKRCAFYWQKPTNHVPMALAQKLSLTVVNPVLGKAKGQFSEVAARLPALLASGLAVVLAFRFIGYLGGTASLALLLLLHPWHLRYGVEARAYAFLIPLCLSALLAARQVVVTQARSWRPLAWLGLNQALWIWCFPFAVIDVGLLFAVVGWLLWREHREHRADGVTALLRWVVVHVFAALLVLQLFFPCALQAVYAKEKDNTPLLLDARLLKETLSQVAFGTEWQQADGNAPEAQHLASLVKVMGSELWANGALVLVIGTALLGLRHLTQRMPRTGLIALCPLLAAMVFMLMCWKMKIFFYPRFVITLLPMLVIGLAELPGMLADYVQTRRKIALGMLALFAACTMHQRAVLRSVPYTGYKDMAEYLQQQPEPAPLVLCLGLGREALPLYYPQMRGVVTVAELEAAAAEAKAAGRPLLVAQGYTGFHRVVLPEAMKHLEQSGKYLVVKEWPGLEANFFFRLWMAKP